MRCALLLVVALAACRTTTPTSVNTRHPIHKLTPSGTTEGYADAWYIVDPNTHTCLLCTPSGVTAVDCGLLASNVSDAARLITWLPTSAPER